MSAASHPPIPPTSPDSSDPDDDPRPLIGEWNHLEACVGQRGVGKSTYQCARARELADQAGGAYVIGHSLGARLPEALPAELGGGKLPIVYHPTIAELARGLRKHPERWHILAPPILASGDNAPETADDLLKFSISLSEGIRKAAWRREHPLRPFKQTSKTLGLPATPIVVIVDEGIAVEAASTGSRGRSDDNRWFLQMIYSLRHMHTALLYAIQEPSARSWRLLEAATAVHIFKIRHRWALNAIEAAGASPEEIDQIQCLQPYQRVTIK
jgi:hypothetical protein